MEVLNYGKNWNFNKKGNVNLILYTQNNKIFRIKNVNFHLILVILKLLF